MKTLTPTHIDLPRVIRLLDHLSNMIEGGRLIEMAIPEDYHWLVNELTAINNPLDGGAPEDIMTRREAKLLVDMLDIGDTAQMAFDADSDEAEHHALHNALRIAREHCPDLPEDEDGNEPAEKPLYYTADKIPVIPPDMKLSNITLNLLSTASSAYPDGFIAGVLNHETGHINPEPCHDTLAEFIAKEIADVTLGEKSERKAALAAFTSIERAIEDLTVVAKALAAALNDAVEAPYRQRRD